MGNKPTKVEDTAERAKSKDIEKDLAKEKRLLEKELKLLILGAGESGKSTFLKQIKMIYGQGFTAADIINYKDLIFTNVIKTLQDIIAAIKDDETALQIDQSMFESVAHISTLKVGHEHRFHPADVAAVKALWGDEGVKACWSKRHLYQIYANTDYFFHEIDRVSVADYQPTDTDILKLRMPTTGIVETVFELDGYKFRVLDVGGQRSERKKWVVCFPDVTVVIFVVAISEFNQELYEDKTQNRLMESLKLFDEMVNCEHFKNTPVILFLNKEDLLREKLEKGQTIATIFPEYTGGSDFDNTVNFIKDQFMSLNKNKTREIFTKVTNATDKKNMKYVFDAVTSVLMNARISSTGL